MVQPHKQAPGSCIATGCSAPQCPANSGGAEEAYWWDCLGRPPPLPSAFFFLSPASLPASALSALWNLSLQNAFPSPTGYKQRRCPLRWVGLRSLQLVSKGRGPHELLSFPCPPPPPTTARGVRVRSPLRGWVLLGAVAGEAGGGGAVRDPRDTVVRLDSAPTQRPGLPRPTQPRAACLFVSKPRVRLTRSHQGSGAALARVGGPLWS